MGHIQDESSQSLLFKFSFPKLFSIPVLCYQLRHDVPMYIIQNWPPSDLDILMCLKRSQVAAAAAAAPAVATLLPAPTYTAYSSIIV